MHTAETSKEMANRLNPVASSVIFSVVYFVVVIVVAHFFSPPGYRWTRNTISELAGQGHERKWIMQAGFIGFRLLLNIGIILTFAAAEKVLYPDILIMIYGLAVLLSGFFCTAPIDTSIGYSVSEARLHSILASVAGVSFSLGVLGHLVSCAHPSGRWCHLAFLVLTLGSSMLFGLSENGVIGIGKGVIQRVLYTTSFIWLVVGQYCTLSS